MTDSNNVWRPNYFEYNFVGSKLRLDYLVIKLIDYRDKLIELEQDNRPFANIIYIHLIALVAKRKSDQHRSNIKFQLTRRLYDKGMNKQQIQTFYYFIDWLIGLPKSLEIEYTNKINALEEAKNMAYISSAEKIGIEKGYAKGLTLGREQGRVQGIDKGIQQGESILLFRLITLKFGHIADNYRQRIVDANPETLLRWGERILNASVIEDIFLEK